MEKICEQCNSQFKISQKDLEFFKKVSPVFNGEKHNIPVPRMCPLCRQQRRLAFRNERAFYNRKCDMSGKSIISIFSPDMPYKVYDQDEWWSDKWNALSYGRDFDFSKTFSEQLRALHLEVPHVSLYNINVENSYYTNYALNQKNCYLIFGAGNNEDCLFGKFIVECKDVVDSLSVFSCELCYEGISSEKCYGCKYFINCRNCSNCLMIEDCSGCKNCIACFGLRAKEYCIGNKQYSKEDYENISADYKELTEEKIEKLRRFLDDIKSKLPHIQSHIYNSENCTGDGLYNCKNCTNAFDCKDCEECNNIYFVPKTIESQDCIFAAPDGVRFCYNVCSTVDLEKSMSTFLVWYGSDIYYSMECQSCNNIFGCIGLKNSKYCILNKQYSKEEYEKLASKIIEHMQKTGEWGEYFPYSIMPFPYNETIAQEYFPLTKEEATELGASWNEDRKEAKEFKLIPQELKFYERMGLPIPTKHPDQRHFDRIKKHNFIQLFSRTCDKCRVEIKTIHSLDSKGKIYCEECYLKEVY
jgi:hypothetical protein